MTSVMDSRDLIKGISVTGVFDIGERDYLRLSFFKSSFICSNCCAVTLAFAIYINQTLFVSEIILFANRRFDEIDKEFRIDSSRRRLSDRS
jgi:hypothetical protein